MKEFDYPAAVGVWQRVNPQEHPYPDPPQQLMSAPVSTGGGEGLYRALLREEVHHMQQVLAVMEKALA